MVPCVVGDECELLVLQRNAVVAVVENLCLGCDGFNGKRSGTLGLGVVDLVVVDNAEGRLLAHNGTEHRLALIVGSLGTIYYRTALYSHATLVVLHVLVGNNGTYRHVKVDAHNVALLDVLHRQIALVGCKVGIYLLAVYRYGVGGTLAVAVLIEVAWQHLILYPSRYAHQQIGILGCRLYYANLDVAVPRILCALLEHHFLAANMNGRCVGSVQIDIYVIVLHAIQIAWNRRNEAAEIAGAASATEPRLTCGVVVGIEGILAVA